MSAPPAPPRTAMTGLRATFYREYLILTRNRTNLLLAVIPTALYLLLFATSLNGLVGEVRDGGRVVDYAEFTIPAIMVSSMLAAAATSATSLFQEELGRMALELWSYPLHRRSYIAGKLLATSALVFAQSLAALVVSAVVFDVGWPPQRWAGLLLATLIASVTFNALYLLLATAVREFQRFMVLVNVIGPTLLFASPSFYPRARMPLALQWASTLNPVTYGIECLRDAALTGFTEALPWCAVLLVLAVALLVVIGRVLGKRIDEL